MAICLRLAVAVVSARDHSFGLSVSPLHTRTRVAPYSLISSNCSPSTKIPTTRLILATNVTDHIRLFMGPHRPHRVTIASDSDAFTSSVQHLSLSVELVIAMYRHTLVRQVGWGGQNVARYTAYTTLSTGLRRRLRSPENIPYSLKF
jgi:hypothetical protein